MAGRIFQIVEHLRDGDGVSLVARRLAALLAASGGETQILVQHADPGVRPETTPIGRIVWHADDVAVVHVSGPTVLAPLLARIPARVVLYFHNITPPEFFAPGSGLAHYTRRGWDELPRLAGAADAWVAPSAYNLRALEETSGTRRPSWVIPPPIDLLAERAAPLDALRLAALRARGERNFLAVGRLVPNKRFEHTMDAFDWYHTRIDPRSRLQLVGDPSVDHDYTRRLLAHRDSLASGAAIEMTGAVRDDTLHAHFAAADAYLALSEHEGFCLPPVVAFAHDVPVFARAAAALPETVGDGAVLLHAVDAARTAEVVHAVLADEGLRGRLVAAGRRALARFAPAAVQSLWTSALDAVRATAPRAAGAR
jgi:glycosyltransferase involved in cell wall biosynthesis